MQPLRPHGHSAPSFFTTMWPISAAAPRPFQGLPSSTMPPPTRVPQNTPSNDLNGLPAPSLNSASVATDTSLPIVTGAPPTALLSSRASGNASIQSDKLRALATVPRRVSISPGEPTPTDVRDDVWTPAAAAASSSAPAISAVIARGPPSTGVCLRASPATAPRPFRITAWILVPPRSMPPRPLMPSAILTRNAARARLELPRERELPAACQPDAGTDARPEACSPDPEAAREGSTLVRAHVAL